MRRLCLGLVLGLPAGCDPANDEPPHPPPEVYEDPSDFSGKWRGEVDGVGGTLRIDRLGEGRYYANFRGETRPDRYILSMTQTRAEVADGDSELANIASFTWQDGRGAVGGGWMLINRENTTITGTFGRGGAMSGMGVWTFVRGDVGR